MIELFDYQKEGAEFIEQKKKVYLAFEMGLGKTITSIAGVLKSGKKNILLVAEKNEIVNSENFRKEVENHFLSLDYVSLREVSIDEVRASDCRMVCGINPDALSKISEKDLDLFDAMIMDEATLAKTATSIRFKSVRRIAKRMEYVVLLSGTPMMNGASELFAPLLLLDHPLAGKGAKVDQTAFEKVFAGGFWKKIRSTEGLTREEIQRQFWKYYTWWAKGGNNVRELRWLIENKFLFKQKNETNVFKKKTRAVKKIPMCKEWIEEYEKAWAEYLERVKEFNRKAVRSDMKSIKNITELKNLIENGQVYQTNSRWKAQEVVKDIQSGVYKDKRIIIFSVFIETDNIIQEELEKAGVSFKTFKDVKDWKFSNEQVLVGRIKSHAKGGNAAEASVTLFVDMDFVPTMNLQAENRMDRPEQKNEMEVVYYMAEGHGDIDQHVQKINTDKMRKIDEFTRPFTEEERAEMPGRIDALIKKYPKEFERMLGITSL